MNEDERSAMHSLNLNAMMALPDEVYEAHKGRTAVMVDGRLLRSFDKVRDAIKFATVNVPDGAYSLQEVRKEPHFVGCF